MKALKDCEWEVQLTLFKSDDCYKWVAYPSLKTQYWNGEIFSLQYYKRKSSAIKSWEKFAKLNGITNYKIGD